MCHKYTFLTTFVLHYTVVLSHSTWDMCFYDNVATQAHTAASHVCQAFSIRYKMIPYNLLKGELSLNLNLHFKR